jgi:ubiquinone/menaquinone biosynthesis C-methylase UbiE
MFSDPLRNIEQFDLRDGHVVADFGSGSGHVTKLIAHAVAPTGKVYAIDLNQDLLLRLKNEAQQQHVRNIDTIVGDLEKLGGTKIREMSIDRVVVSNILFMLSDRRCCVSEIRRILKPRGKVLVVDWSASFGHMGPHPEHVLYKEVAIKLFTELGFEVEKEIEAGDNHYGIIFIKK